VRQGRVAVVTCWFELSLLCGFLRGLLLAAALFRCLLLSTFLSCHKLYVLLLFKIRFSVMTTR
jgi:hypothetical protein